MFKNWKTQQHFSSLEDAKSSVNTREGHRWASLTWVLILVQRSYKSVSLLNSQKGLSGSKQTRLSNLHLWLWFLYLKATGVSGVFITTLAEPATVKMIQDPEF